MIIINNTTLRPKTHVAGTPQIPIFSKNRQSDVQTYVLSTCPNTCPSACPSTCLKHMSKHTFGANAPRRCVAGGAMRDVQRGRSAVPAPLVLDGPAPPMDGG